MDFDKIKFFLYKLYQKNKNYTLEIIVYQIGVLTTPTA